MIDRLHMFGPVTSQYRSIASVFLTALLLSLTFAASPLALRPSESETRSYVTPPPHTRATQGIGEPVPHVECEPGYTNSLYARGLWSPDGLAFGPTGHLYVVEEEADRVSRVESDRTVTRVLQDLDSPEGIAFDEAGNLYVVEDTPAGRLIRMTPDGDVTTLVSGLAAPEGVVVSPGHPDTGHPTLYVTESNVQFMDSPLNLQTRITAVSLPDEATSNWETRTIISHAPILSGSMIAFWSYAGIAQAPDGRLYVTNELAGQEITRYIEIIFDALTYKATLATRDSIFAIDPSTGTRTLVASGLLSPEGLSFSTDGNFPLYVAEESTRYDARLSRIESDGQRTTVCGNFRGIEDVTVDPQGNLYISEDRSGYVIQIRPTEPPLVNKTPGEENTVAAPPQTGQPDVAPKARETTPNAAGFLSAAWNQIIKLVQRVTQLAQQLRGKSGASGADNQSIDKDLKTWDRAVIRDTGAEGLHCRAAAGLDTPIVHTLEEGVEVTLLRGPTRRDGYVWWQVEALDGEPCWAAENWLYPPR
jgi:sugar lactone lactonase YvrE